MKEVLQLAGLSFLMFVTGLLVGVNANVGSKYLAGRISACNQIVKLDPILAVAEVTCVPYNGDVALKVGDRLYSLDGKTLN
jgi:hypothetical protein